MGLGDVDWDFYVSLGARGDTTRAGVGFSIVRSTWWKINNGSLMVVSFCLPSMYYVEKKAMVNLQYPAGVSEWLVCGAVKVKVLYTS